MTRFISIQPNRRSGYRRYLRQEVLDALDQGAKVVVVECSSWSGLDLMLLSTLIGCATQCRDHGSTLRLDNLNETVRSSIEALRVADRLPIETTTARPVAVAS